MGKQSSHCCWALLGQERADAVGRAIFLPSFHTSCSQLRSSPNNRLMGKVKAEPRPRAPSSPSVVQGLRHH